MANSQMFCVLYFKTCKFQILYFYFMLLSKIKAKDCTEQLPPVALSLRNTVVVLLMLPIWFTFFRGLTQHAQLKVMAMGFFIIISEL